MAHPPPLSLLLLLTALLLLTTSLSQADQTDTTNLRLTTWASDDYTVFDDLEDINDGLSTESDRRSLYWTRRHYYISYGALSANRIPCSARSGRSYYTHNCYGATGPVRPYIRGCSAISRCRI